MSPCFVNAAGINDVVGIYYCMRYTLKLLCLYYSVITRGKLVAHLSLYETPHL